MADILSGEMQKKYIRLSVWMLKKKLKISDRIIKEDMENCGNPVFAKLYRDMVNDANKVEEGFQRDTIIELGGIGLWMMYKDTAYKDIMIHIMNTVLDKKDEYKKAIKPYLKEHEQWYVNEWHRSMEDTKKGREKGTVGKFGKSETEKIFTPTEQTKKLKRIR